VGRFEEELPQHLRSKRAIRRPRQFSLKGGELGQIAMLFPSGIDRPV